MLLSTDDRSIARRKLASCIVLPGEGVILTIQPTTSLRTHANTLLMTTGQVREEDKAQEKSPIIH